MDEALQAHEPLKVSVSSVKLVNDLVPLLDLVFSIAKNGLSTSNLPLLLSLFEKAKVVYADGKAAFPELQAGYDGQDLLSLGGAILQALVKLYEDQSGS